MVDLVHFYVQSPTPPPHQVSRPRSLVPGPGSDDTPCAVPNLGAGPPGSTPSGLVLRSPPSQRALQALFYRLVEACRAAETQDEVHKINAAWFASRAVARSGEAEWGEERTQSPRAKAWL